MINEGEDLNEQELDSEELNVASDNYAMLHNEHDLGVVGDNNRPSGRPTEDEVFERQRCMDLRDEFSNCIRIAGMARPRKESTKNDRRDRHNRMI